MREKLKNLSSTIFGLVIVIWFFASMFGIIYFSKRNEYYLMMIFGQMFFVCGIMIFKLEWWVGLLFGVVGLSLLIIPYLILNPDILPVQVDWGYFVMKYVFILFIASGVIIVGFNFFKNLWIAITSRSNSFSCSVL